jgi:hypothetical protein
MVCNRGMGSNALFITFPAHLTPLNYRSTRRRLAKPHGNHKTGGAERDASSSPFSACAISRFAWPPPVYFFWRRAFVTYPALSAVRAGWMLKCRGKVWSPTEGG